MIDKEKIINYLCSEIRFLSTASREVRPEIMERIELLRKIRELAESGKFDKDIEEINSGNYK